MEIACKFIFMLRIVILKSHEIIENILSNVYLSLISTIIFLNIFPPLAFVIAIILSVIIISVNLDQDEQKHKISKLTVKGTWYIISLILIISSFWSEDTDILYQITILGIAMIESADNISEAYKKKQKTKN